MEKLDVVCTFPDTSVLQCLHLKSLICLKEFLGPWIKYQRTKYQLVYMNFLRGETQPRTKLGKFILKRVNRLSET